MRLSKPAGRFELGRPDSFTVIFHYATSALEVNGDEGRMRTCIQRVFDQVYNHSVQVSD